MEITKGTYISKEGSIVDIYEVNEESVHFHPQGGGFGKIMKTSEFKEHFTPFKIPNELVSAVFDIDHLLFAKGFHNPHVRWNGWAVPYFPKEQFEKIFSDVDYIADLDMEALTYFDTNYDETVELSSIEHNGQLLIANEGWCWDVTEKPDDAEINEHYQWLKSTGQDKSLDAFVQKESHESLYKNDDCDRLFFHLRMLMLDLDPWVAPENKAGNALSM